METRQLVLALVLALAVGLLCFGFGTTVQNAAAAAGGTILGSLIAAAITAAR